MKGISMGTFEDAHSRVKALCDHFDARYEEVMSPDYREAVARAEIAALRISAQIPAFGCAL